MAFSTSHIFRDYLQEQRNFLLHRLLALFKTISEKNPIVPGSIGVLVYKLPSIFFLNVITDISPGQLKRTGILDGPTPQLVYPCIFLYVQSPAAVKRGALLLVKTGVPSARQI